MFIYLQCSSFRGSNVCCFKSQLTLIRPGFSESGKPVDCNKLFLWLTSHFVSVILKRGLLQTQLWKSLSRITKDHPVWSMCSTVRCTVQAEGVQYRLLEALFFCTLSLCNFPIWPMTMKFGGVILCQKLYQQIIKHLITSWLWRFYDVILYFRLHSAEKK